MASAGTPRATKSGATSRQPEASQFCPCTRIATRAAGSRLVDDRAARGVDEDRSALHLAEAVRVHQVTRLGKERHVQRYEVAAREKVVKALDIHGTELLLRARITARVLIEDAHREAVGASRHREPDPAHADDAKRRAVDILPREHEVRQAAVLAGTEKTLFLAEPACGG